MSNKAGSTGNRRVIAQVALAVGLLSAAFVLVMCALLSATHVQSRNADPLNNATLLALRDRYAEGERSDQVKADIRQLDLLARKAFFTSQSQIRTGGQLAMAAGVLMLMAFGVYQVSMRTVPPPSRESCEGMFWVGVERSRVWVCGGTFLLVALSVVMAISTRTELTSDVVSAGEDNPEPLSPPGDVPATPLGPISSPVFPAGFSENAPVHRGASGSGKTDFGDVPAEWDAAAGKNVLWKKSLEYPAWASPVVWGDKVITLGASAERRMVYCLDAATGEDAWTTDVPVHDDATRDYTPDTMDPRWDLLVYAGATPAVNGRQVFALFSNGQLVALDLATGNVLWNIAPAATGSNKFGLDNSLLVYKDSVIVVFEGDERFVARYDAATGREIWKTERTSSSWASPILAKRADGSYLVVLPADPDVTAWDPETGKQAWTSDVLTGGPDWCVGPSPVQVGDRVCVNCQNCGIYGIDLADGSIAWRIEELPDGSGFADGPSMTTDGKYLYQFYGSVLTCVDAQSGAVVKQKELDEEANYASALSNQGKLYLSGEGVVLVLNADPASGFAEVGKGLLDESSDATPAIVRGRVYMRSDESLYCFGVK